MAPLVSVGIPTYNRAASLESAVRSVLAQDHRELEVVVSDDASTDDTPAVLERLAAQDPRVVPRRQERNVGHARNFAQVFELSQGDYFMWLSDDDQLEPGYVRRCLEELRSDASLVGVCGRGRYHRHGEPAVLERPMNLTAPSPARRVLLYFAQVTLNGALYCLWPRAELERVPFREVLSGDWVLVGALAARGRVITLEDVHILRSLSGISTDATQLAEREFGRSGPIERHLPHVGSGWVVFRHIAREEPAFAVLGRPRRWLVACLAGALIAIRFSTVAYGRRLLARFGMLDAARRVIAPLRARRHRPGS
jgi:hypothetical protein